MQEIYRNSAERTVSLTVPLTAVGGTVDVQVCYGGETVYDVPLVAVDVETNTYSFDLPFFLVQYDRRLEVNWKFDYTENGETYHFEDMTPVRVVTPLLSLAVIKQISPGMDDEAAKIIEGQIRHIIENITGQSFGYYVGPRAITGQGGKSLKMPMRLISIDGVETLQYVYNVSAYTIISGGWYLMQNSASLMTVKEMPPEWSLDAGPVIQTPYTAYYAGFRPYTKYIVTGRWGYTAVPAEVELAARLLVEEYACPEAAYRDKMLKSIKTGDWQIQMSSVSWETTGHVRADQLLSQFVLFDWVVI